jgi:hypothetical protein
MKTSKSTQIARIAFYVILSAVIVITSFSCTRTLYFGTSPVVPAAEGKVTIRKDRNKNYVIQVRVSDMAEVSRLQVAKLTYVVWMGSDKGRTENIGQLKSSRTFFTKQLKASLNTISTSSPDKIFITSENDGSTSYPIGQVILTTDKF